MTDRPTVVGGGFPSPRSGAAWDAARFASLRPARIGRRFAEVVVAERERWSLWTPVGLGTGIALYFALPFEPSIWLGLSSTALALGAVAVARGRPAWMIAALACALVVVGFTVAGLRTHSLAAPILAKPLRPALVSGRVVESAVRKGGRRLVLDRVRIARVDAAATPLRVRVSVRRADSVLAPGDWVSVRAVLSPPPEPAAPGAFDFARKAYFARIGAVGFALGPARVMAAPAGAAGYDWRAAIGRLRHAVTARLLAGLDGQAGAVAAALLTGERGAIADDVLAAMRDAGLAHLLAISGLHLGLVATILFFAVRALLALSEALALRFAIKKWAACAALAGTFLYLLLAGATIPTQRAFLMSGLVIVAILLDRTGVSMRSVAWAAVAVLLLRPESLLSASFQMSFAAVTALVAVFERYRDREARRVRERAPRRVLAYVVGVAVVTLVAGLATAPFAVYHFNRLAVYGLAANLLAVPTTAMWIMPWGIAALALMPLGLEALALAPMGWGIDVVIAVARTVAGWPGSVVLLPAMPSAALVLAAAGGLWLCLWRRRWRWLGLLAFAAGLASAGLTRTPDVLVDGKAKLFAVRTADGGLAISSRRTARYTGDIWLRRNGQAGARPWSGDGPGLRCDAIACIYRSAGRVVALVRDGRALAEDCRVADVVVSAVPMRRYCASARVAIDRVDLACAGTHALYLEESGVRIETVAARRGDRPWSRRRGARC